MPEDSSKPGHRDSQPADSPLTLHHEPALIMKHVPASDCSEMAATLQNAGFGLQAARKGMVMQKIRDSFDISFNLGEILASEAMARYGDAAGYGILIGDNLEGAFVLACLDAACKFEDHEQYKFISRWIIGFEHLYLKSLEESRNMAKSTRVNFGLMAEG